MKKPMSRLLASVLAAIMLINCMVVTALAADARVISMNYQPHPLYPGMNGNAVVEVDTVTALGVAFAWSLPRTALPSVPRSPYRKQTPL